MTWRKMTATAPATGVPWQPGTSLTERVGLIDVRLRMYPATIASLAAPERSHHIIGPPPAQDRASDNRGHQEQRRAEDRQPLSRSLPAGIQGQQRDGLANPPGCNDGDNSQQYGIGFDVSPELAGPPCGLRLGSRRLLR